MGEYPNICFIFRHLSSLTHLVIEINSKSELKMTVYTRHTDKSRSSRYRDIGNLAVAIAISGK